MWIVVGWGNIHVSVFSYFSDKLLKMSVFLPHISQKEESVEQPEFRYDEFGFRVDKEGKTGPVPPTCIVSSPSHAFKCGRILQPVLC